MKSRETAQRTLILGGGLSGDATLRYLQQRDDLVVVDTRLDVAEQLAKQYPEVRVRQISEPASLTELLLRPERGFDRAVVSPGLSDEHPLVRALLDAAIPITTDIDLFCTAVQVPVIGCTGTNGKSTVTALIEELLKGQGVRALAGGNLGPAALDLLRQDPDVAVLELSSFQLQRAGPLPLGIALFLNLADDHVDYHGSYAAYQRAKLRIFEAASCRVWNRDDPATQGPLQADGVMSFGLGSLANDEQGAGIDRSPDGTERLIVRCGERLLPLLPVRLLGLPGRHNLANALAAVTACVVQLERLGRALDEHALNDTLRAFRGLPHRCEPVGEVDGVRFVNDSKATNVAAAIAAVRGIKPSVEGQLVLLLGGQAKGADLAPLAAELVGVVDLAVVYGEDRDAFCRALRGRVPIVECDAAADAFDQATAVAQPGDLVLLAPAAASFDEFASYRARGEWFRERVQAQSARVLEVRGQQ